MRNEKGEDSMLKRPGGSEQEKATQGTDKEVSEEEGDKEEINERDEEEDEDSERGTEAGSYDREAEGPTAISTGPHGMVCN